MKNNCLSLLLPVVFFTAYSNAQNLVPNPSFEDTVACPDMGGQVTRAEYWFDLFYTPDYFHTCCVFPQFHVPSNTLGYQYPHSGDAYMGMWVYQSPNNIREIIGAYLTAPLIIGQKYFINFKANCAYNFPFAGNNTACNKLGILFSTVSYLSSPPPINNFAQIFTDSIISDTLNWITIRGSFIADSAYTFISIGNFFDNAHTDTLHLANSNSYQAYVYVDDFCISDDSIYTEVWTSFPEHETDNILIFPIPATENITIKNLPLDCDAIDIYNSEGKKIDSFKVIKNNYHIVNISNLSSGFYTLVIIHKRGIQTKRIVKF